MGELWVAGLYVGLEPTLEFNLRRNFTDVWNPQTLIVQYACIVLWTIEFHVSFYMGSIWKFLPTQASAGM